ncbi:transmembrane protein 94-like [Toxotes jaculatrix]|uniref:transmembrane protein 94-like n=1 Tax=Toxotes jaculatrix TaxID=941984 RepID=UPI001B3B05D7|nr:transmembrane protein 94-like [Toxotes jaculatrix]
MAELIWRAMRDQVFAEKMGLETGWNCHISLTPNGDRPCDGAPSSPSHGSLHEDLNQASLWTLCTRLNVRGRRLAMPPEEASTETLRVLSPLRLSGQLNSLGCSVIFHQGESVSMVKLIEQARHTTYGIRKCFLFLLQCQLSLVIIQFLACLAHCPLLRYTHNKTL